MVSVSIAEMTTPDDISILKASATAINTKTATFGTGPAP